METQIGTGGQFDVNRYINGERAMSPESSKPKLQLPPSCDPPGPGNPAKQLVWIVSVLLHLLPRSTFAGKTADREPATLNLH